MSDPQTTKLGPAAQKIADGLNDAIEGRYKLTSLEDRDRRLLQAIGEIGGTESGTAAVIAWGFSDRRQKAQEAVRRFRTLEARGLVRKLDDQKPICWVREAAGTKAMIVETNNGQ